MKYQHLIPIIVKSYLKINNKIGLTIVGNSKLHNIIIQQWLMKFRGYLESIQKENVNISVISNEFINFFNQMNSSSKNIGKTEIDSKIEESSDRIPFING